MKSYNSLRSWLAIACLFPCLGALSVSFLPSAQKELLEKVEKPMLAFQEYLIDKHEIAVARKSVVARFSFVNHGTQPIHIDAIRPSCGCVTTRIAKQDFAAGEKGEFYLQVDTANEDAGYKEYTAEVTYTGNKTETAEVEFRMILPEKKLSVRPRALIFYHFNDKDVSTQKLVLTDYRKANFEITKVESSLDFVRPVMGSSKKDSNGIPQASVHVTVTENVPKGRHQTNVVIHTTDPDYPKIEVPILIERGELPKAVSTKQTKPEAKKVASKEEASNL